MENDFQIKEINAKESVTFQNEENERDLHKETKRVETCNKNKVKRIPGFHSRDNDHSNGCYPLSLCPSYVNKSETRARGVRDGSAPWGRGCEMILCIRKI